MKVLLFFMRFGHFYPTTDIPFLTFMICIEQQMGKYDMEMHFLLVTP
jgi:hypothetical protein